MRVCSFHCHQLLVTARHRVNDLACMHAPVDDVTGPSHPDATAFDATMKHHSSPRGLFHRVKLLWKLGNAL